MSVKSILKVTLTDTNKETRMYLIDRNTLSHHTL